MINKIWQHKNIKESFLGSLKGLMVVIKTERNAKIIFAIGVIVILVGLILKVSLQEFIVIIILTIGVFICEVFNTLIENILDIIQPQNDHKVKILKDIASGAVLISSIGAAIVGIIIFAPKINTLIINLIMNLNLSLK
ncbi:MAG: diacylglycerol kinase family protein [Candidatus Omnitrophica bacterium]|nr:diacylglycerol kinase family protein [Candidatus Omnitrophota bacterium]MCM8827051.1 diacylglycerol kinase family protein [Candidatus Omnitrophota bacterium]